MSTYRLTSVQHYRYTRYQVYSRTQAACLRVLLRPSYVVVPRPFLLLVFDVCVVVLGVGIAVGAAFVFTLARASVHGVVQYEQ